MLHCRRMHRLLCLALLVALLVALPAAAATPKRPRAPRNAPNVLLILADDLRDWVGWMGGHPQAQTPNMDRLARRGMRFSNAHCSFALCNPSRTSLMTGLLPSSSGVFGNEQDWRRSIQIAGKATLPEHLRGLGFLTAAAGKIFHANHGGPDSRLTGWHGGRRGFEQDAAWDQRFPAPGLQIPELPVPTGQNYNGLDIWHWDWGALDLPDVLTEDGAVWWEGLQNGMWFGIPQVGMVDNNGNYLENQQLDPDVRQPLEPGIVSQGRDQQLEAAVKLLLGR